MSSCGRPTPSKRGGCAGSYGNAFDPVNKFWLGYSLGERSLLTLQRLVHQVIHRLVPGKIPLFLTDGEPSFESALVGHFGQWGEVSNEGQTQRRWLPLAQLEYVQVIKQRVKRCLVQVKQGLVSRNLDNIRAKLAAHGWGINTAFIERFNLTSVGPARPGLGPTGSGLCSA